MIEKGIFFGLGRNWTYAGCIYIYRDYIKPFSCETTLILLRFFTLHAYIDNIQSKDTDNIYASSKYT